MAGLIPDIETEVIASLADFDAKMDELTDRLKTLRDGDYGAAITIDTAPFNAEVDEMKARLDALNDHVITPEVAMGGAAAEGAAAGATGEEDASEAALLAAGAEGAAKDVEDAEKDVEGKSSTFADHVKNIFTSVGSTMGNWGLPFGESVTKMGENISEAETKGKGFMTAMSSIGKVSLVAGAAIAVGIGAESIHLADEFQTSMTQLVTGAGQSQKGLDAVSSGILNMASAVGETAGNLASGMYMIESAGYHGAQGLTILKAAAEGAKTGNAELATTASAVTGAMTNYNIPTSRANAVMSALIETVASGKMHLQDLGASLGKVMPQAAALGVSFQDVTGAMATMTNANMTAKLAAQHLSNTILALSAPSGLPSAATSASQTATANKNLATSADAVASAQEALKNVQAEVAAKTYKGAEATAQLDAAQLKVKQSTQAYADEQKVLASNLQGLNPGSTGAVAAMNEVGLSAQQVKNELGEHGLAAALKLIETHVSQTFPKDSAEGVSAFKAIMGGVTGYSTALMLTGSRSAAFAANVKNIGAVLHGGSSQVQGFNVVQKDFGFQMDQAKAAADAFGIKIGEKLLPILQDFIRILGEVVGWLTKHIVVAEVLAGIIGGALVTAIAAYVVSLGIAAAETVIDMAKIIGSLISWGISTAVTIGETLVLWASYAVEWLATQLPAMIEFITQHAIMAGLFIVQNAAMAVSATLAFIAENAAMLGIGLAIAVLVAAIIWMATHWKEVWDIVKKVADDAWHHLDGVWHAIDKVFRGVWGGIEKFLVGLWNGIEKFLDGVWQAIDGAIRTAWGAIEDFFADVWNDIYRDTVLGVEKLIEDLKIGWDRASSDVHNWIVDVLNFIAKLWRDVTTDVSKGISDVVSYFTSLPERAARGFSSLYTKVYNFFSGIFTWLHVKAAKGIADFVSFFTGLPSAVMNAVGSLLGDMLQFGEKIVHNIVSGIGNVAGDIVSAIAKAIPGGSLISKGISDVTSLLHAKGGIVTKPTLGIIGEAGPEAIIPLSGIATGGVRPLPAVGAASGGGGGQTIVFQVDGKTIAQVLVPTMRSQQLVAARATGNIYGPYAGR